MSTQLQRKQWEAQAAAQREENIAVYKQWIERRPEIRDCIATFKAVEEFCGFSEMPLSIEELDFALSNGMRVVKQRVSQAELVAEENARRKAMSVDELRQLARQERPVPQPDALPQFYTPMGNKEAVELTAEVLRKLSTADLKFLIRRFGASEVNKRLGVKPTIQPGISTRLKI
jgi:hypothetical protein